MLTAYNKLTDKVFPSDRPLGYRTGTYTPVVLLTHQHQSTSNFLFRPAGQARQSFAVVRAWNLPRWYLIKGCCSTQGEKPSNTRTRKSSRSVSTKGKPESLRGLDDWNRRRDLNPRPPSMTAGPLTAESTPVYQGTFNSLYIPKIYACYIAVRALFLFLFHYCIYIIS